MKWFGENWGASVCELEKHESTPVGTLCGFCHEPIQTTHQGVIVPYHSETEDTEMAAHLRCFRRALGIDAPR